MTRRGNPHPAELPRRPDARAAAGNCRLWRCRCRRIESFAASWIRCPPPPGGRCAGGGGPSGDSALVWRAVWPTGHPARGGDGGSRRGPRRFSAGALPASAVALSVYRSAWLRTGGPLTSRSRRRTDRRWTLTAGPGTGPRPRPGRTGGRRGPRAVGGPGPGRGLAAAAAAVRRRAVALTEDPARRAERAPSGRHRPAGGPSARLNRWPRRAGPLDELASAADSAADGSRSSRTSAATLLAAAQQPSGSALSLIWP